MGGTYAGGGLKVEFRSTAAVLDCGNAHVMRPYGVHWQTPGFQSASLDHAMWFHKPTDFNQWHLYVHDSPSASDGRGLIRGQIYAEDGTLVASVAQEGLMRMRTPK